ncbi:MAG: T9SS type A sorting domain-containing protein, partial [Bacteroidia bacterium]|nr:T9SS type A sorting domain-containing protein [Bacteroidia bacterium]
LYSYDGLTDANGYFNFSGMFLGNYEIVAGKWGWASNCFQNYSLSQSTSLIIIPLSTGVYDDFTWDWGWTVTGNATTGMWARGVPLGTTFNNTPANPGADVTNDCSLEAYVTGNTGITSSDDDVDGGATILTSPVFDATTFLVPYVTYSRWFFNAGGSGNPNDSLKVMITNGTQTVTLETVIASTSGNSSWVNSAYRMTDFISPTSTMRMIVRTADTTPGHIVEAGFDRFTVVDSLLLTDISNFNSGNISASIYPNPFSDNLFLKYDFHNQPESGRKVLITDMTGKTVEENVIMDSSGIIEIGKNLSSGIYLVQIRNKNFGMKPLKVVKL